MAVVVPAPVVPVVPFVLALPPPEALFVIAELPGPEPGNRDGVEEVEDESGRVCGKSLDLS